jgi:hypothetical protein
MMMPEMIKALRKTFSEEAQKLLDLIDLGHGAHDTWQEGMCVMEAVAFVTGQNQTDEPICVASSIREMMIEANDNNGDTERQKLKQAVPFIVGTRPVKLVEDTDQRWNVDTGKWEEVDVISEVPWEGAPGYSEIEAKRFRVREEMLRAYWIGERSEDDYELDHLVSSYGETPVDEIVKVAKAMAEVGKEKIAAITTEQRLLTDEQIRAQRWEELKASNAYNEGQPVA